MLSPLIRSVLIFLGEFLYVHLEDWLNQAGDFNALHTV
jgi:hypothetical protein